MTQENVNRVGQTERAIVSIPLREMAIRLTRQYPFCRGKEYQGYKPTVIYYFGSQTPDGKTEPYLGLSFDPPLFYASGLHLGVQKYNICDSGIETFYVQRMRAQPEELDVYKVPLLQIMDPNYTKAVETYSPGEIAEILIAGDQREANLIGSWIVDAALRERVKEFAINIERTQKFMKLRRALSDEPDSRLQVDWSNPMIAPKRITYDYAGIKEAVEQRDGNGEYTEADVKWLEKHMRCIEKAT